MAEKPPTPKPTATAADILQRLPRQLNTQIVAALTLDERLALYGLKLDQLQTERKQTDAPEDVVNYTYGTFFADLHGPPAQYPKLVQEYASRIISEGWEPVWWHQPLPRDVNAGGMELARVLSVRIRARRLRMDVTLRR